MTPKAARFALLTVAALLAACAAEPLPAQQEATFDFTLDGLERVESRRLDAAFVRPGVDFSQYTSVVLGEIELAFRTPNRAERQFPLSSDQRMQFQAMLLEAFVEQLSAGDLELVMDHGPSVLRLKVRVQDVTATIPPRGLSGAGGRGSLALTAIGEATLVIELEDSETNEILARAFDTRAAEGIAISTEDGPVTRWEDIERLCDRWATAVRRGLETLVSD